MKNIVEEAVKVLEKGSTRRLACVRVFCAQEARALSSELNKKARFCAEGEGSIEEINIMQRLSAVLLDYAKIQERIEANQSKDIAIAEELYEESLAHMSSSGGSGEDSSVSDQGHSGNAEGEGNSAPDLAKQVDFGNDDLTGMHISWVDGEESYDGVVEDGSQDILRVTKSTTGKANQVSRSNVTGLVKEVKEDEVE